MLGTSGAIEMIIEIGALVIIIGCTVYVEINERTLTKRLAQKEEEHVG